MTEYGAPHLLRLPDHYAAPKTGGRSSTDTSAIPDLATSRLQIASWRQTFGRASGGLKRGGMAQPCPGQRIWQC